MRKTWVIIPCYNEAARLNPSALLEALEGMPGLGFVLVDDGSRDATLQVLNDLHRQAPERIIVLGLSHNSGKAEAVRRGVLHAAAWGATLIGYWDADLATPLAYIERFAGVLDANEQTLLALGARVRMLGRRIERDAVRHYIGRCFATFAGIALGLPVYDTQCGAKLFKVTPPLLSAFEKPFTLRWSFDVELLSRLLKRQHDVGDIDVLRQCVEVPLEEWFDAPGSKVTAAAAPRVALELVTLLLKTRATRDWGAKH